MARHLASVPSPAALRRLAVDAAAARAPALRAAFRAGPSFPTTAARPILKTNHHDLVTDLDHSTEAALVQALTAAVPGSRVLGEETGAHGEPDHPLRWIVDPIDGTSNFAHGFDLFSVSVAAAVEDVVVAGVVHAPAAGIVFSAAAGRGAQLTCSRGTETLGAPSPRTGAGEAPLNMVTSYPAAEALRCEGPPAAASFAELVTTYATVRRVVSGALELCYAATGWADVVLTVDTHPWDIAAGQLILHESGGRLHAHDDAGRPVTPIHQAPHLLGLAPGIEAPTARRVLGDICTRRSSGSS